MIVRLTSKYSRCAATLALALAASLPALCAAPSGASVPADPRVGLKAGMTDAGEAAFGMERLTSLPKPNAFVPPAEPVADDAAKAAPAEPTAEKRAPGAPADAPPTAAEMAAMRAQLTFANSDLAFGGNHLFVGNFYGINFYDIDNPAQTKLVTTLVCPGGQGDVSVYGHLLFMSVEAATGRLDCGTQGIPLPAGYVAPPPPPPGTRPAAPPASPDRFRGVRIFDISNFSSPKQIAAVQSCRGSHTHTLVVDPKDKDNIYIYISGTSYVRPSEELAGCSSADPSKDPNTSLFSIDVIQVPLAAPETAKIVSHPRVFADLQTGAVDGLWKGGNHGEGTQKTSSTNQCHDITVYSAVGLAAGACSGNGILLNISDPVHPVRLDAVSDPNYAFWHSASFNNDGTKVLFTDEWGGGTQPRCRATDPINWGADAIFTLAKGKMTLASYYKMPAAQTETENCVAHNGSLIPIPGRDIEVQGWYQGGVSIVDFTDAAHPVEIGYFDRGPIDAKKRVIGGDWAAYWYNGYIYGSEIARGLDVFRLVPNKYISQNEIDAAKLVHYDELNVQNQQKIVWPSSFVVARAYLDQLSRSNTLAPKRVAAVNAAILRAEKSTSPGKELARLNATAVGLEKESGAARTPADANRLHKLAEILKKGGTTVQ
jgi:hypothetical protein